MVLIVGTSYKRMGIEPDVRWSNVYMLDAANAVAALDILEDIATAEAAVMGESALVYRLHCINKVGGTGVVREVSIDGSQPVADPVQRLPMWNTVKVTFTNVSGRPEIKYLRLPLYIDMIEGQEINNAVLTTVTLGYAQALLAIPQYVGPNGETHQDHEVASLIQMRQTDWHRRHRPGFKRGWVPA